MSDTWSMNLSNNLLEVLEKMFSFADTNVFYTVALSVVIEYIVVLTDVINQGHRNACNCKYIIKTLV